ncbi:MAG: hypothetical protein EOP51_02800 [Sphingobacteriales bacterium]|nr:MAG: hypothetical protein EOP51_02800 [Sphingobacteriales bacterium]
MNLKTGLLSAATLLSFGTTYAQDKIYTRDGDVMEVKVKVIGEKNITYKRVDNEDGPSYIINKKEVERIQYDNGDEDVMVAEHRGPGHPGRPERMERFDKPMKRNKTDYGNNIISAAPLQVTENGPGFGLSYERVLDKKNNIVSFYMPFAMAFNLDNKRVDYYGNYYGYNNNSEHNYSFYAMPGLKFYPTGGKGIIRYAVGPNIILRYSQYTDYNYYDVYNYPNQFIAPYVPYKTERNEFTMGMVVNNSLNINPTKHLHMGLELGIGFSYFTNTNGGYGNYYNGNYYNDRNDPEALVQFGFNIGYRF